MQGWSRWCGIGVQLLPDHCGGGEYGVCVHTMCYWCMGVCGVCIKNVLMGVECCVVPPHVCVDTCPQTGDDDNNAPCALMLHTFPLINSMFSTYFNPTTQHNISTKFLQTPIPCRTVPTQKITRLCMLVAVEYHEQLPTHMRCHLTHSGLPCACFTHQQSGFSSRETMVEEDKHALHAMRPYDAM